MTSPTTESTALTIRPAQEGDLDAILAIYQHARVFMAQNGNPTQWAGVYPSEKDARGDIEQGVGYVFEQDGQVVGTFALIIGDEPTYQQINGAWGWDEEYGTIHRIASSGAARGLSRACFDFCAGKVDYLRIDTHADNAPMRGAILKYGFVPRGTIIYEDGTPRDAFDWHR